MTNERGEKVNLSTNDKTVIGLFFLTQLVLLTGLGVGMWTRLAVLETKVENQAQSIDEVKQIVNRLK